jgi:hypothetical protein
MNKQLWIGLAEVRPLPDCKLLEEAKGAYVHVMAWANDADEFRDAVVLRISELALQLVDLSEIEPWAIRSSGDDPIRDEFFGMQRRIRDDIQSVSFSRFHAWFQDQPMSKTEQSALSPQHSADKARAAQSAHVRQKAGTENGK